MAYRELPHKHKPKTRDVQGLTTPGRILVINGSHKNMAFPCWYTIARPPVRTHPHSRLKHDHCGWPDPKRPDNSCQRSDFSNSPYQRCHRWDHSLGCCSLGYKTCEANCRHLLDMDHVVPIHLREEGYTSVEIATPTELPPGFTVAGWIDEDSDWIVRISIHTQLDEAVKEVYKMPYTALVLAPDRRDIVCMGEIVVLPGSYKYDWQ